MSRRNFLRILGGGSIVAACAATGFLTTRTPTKALEPWQSAGTGYSDPRLRALSFALLAPNPHNRQPWLVELVGTHTVQLFADHNRRLPHTDPFSRQITIGLGCFLELMRLAAASNGFRLATTLFPDGSDASTLDQRPVATVRFVSDGALANDALFDQVFERRSLKAPFDLTRPVPDAVLVALHNAVGSDTRVASTNVPKEVAALRALTHEAMDIEVRTPHTFKESVDLFRIGKAEVEANPDGIDFSGPFFETLRVLGQFSREATLDTTSANYQQGYDAVMANCDTAMAHIWIVSPGNSRIDQINAGRDWLRINLAATAQGVGTQPLSQALQEYPEMTALYQRVHERLAPNGGTVQMLARLGYGPTVPPSPRWRIETRVRQNPAA